MRDTIKDKTIAIAVLIICKLLKVAQLMVCYVKIIYNDNNIY